MARGTVRKNRSVAKGTEALLSKVKYQIASELGIEVPQYDYWGNLTSRDSNAAGSNIVKKD